MATYYTNSKKSMGRTDCSDQFRKIIIHQKRIGYNLNAMRQYVCLVINPITVDNFAALFNCTPVDCASDSMMAFFHFSWLGPELFRLLLGHHGDHLVIFCFGFPVVLFGSPVLQLSRNTLYLLRDLLSPRLVLFVYCDDSLTS